MISKNSQMHYTSCALARSFLFKFPEMQVGGGLSGC